MYDGSRWYLEIVDAVEGFGRGPTLAISPDGTPSLAYGVSQGRTTGILRYASLEHGSWAFSDLTSNFTGPQPPGLVVDSLGNPHVAGGSTEGVEYFSQVGGTWSREVVGNGTTVNSAIGISAGGEPAVSYFLTNPDGFALKYSIRTPTGWDSEDVVTGDHIGGIQLRMDSVGSPHLAFFDITDDRVVYASRPPCPTLNSRPLADGGLAYASFEAERITFYAGGSTDPEGDLLTYRWDFDGDGTWDTSWSSDPTTSYTWGDDWTGAVILEVSDGELTDTASVPVTVVNVAPTIAFTLIPTGDEGETLVFEAQVTDPGSDDLVVRWSNFPGPDTCKLSVETTYPNDPASFPDPDPSTDVHPRDVTDSQSTLCGDDGTFNWTFIAFDDDGGESTKSGTFSIGNLAPALMVPPPTFVTVDEGVAWTLTAIGEDPGSDDLTFTWTWEFGPTDTHAHFNDGVGPDPDPSPGLTFPFTATDSSMHAYGDDGTYEVMLRVEDDDGGFLEVTTTFSTSNLPPALTVSPPTSTTVDEGTLVTLYATAKDPGSDDLTFTWTWTRGPTEAGTYFNDGVGADPDPSPGGTFPFTATDASSRRYGDDCACTVYLRVGDDDGGFLTFETSVTVVNVNPVVLAADASGDEAATIAFAATFTDPGFDGGAGPSVEDFTATVDWGDGSSESVSVSEVPGGPGVPTTGSLAATHVYGDDGAFTVTATVCDDDDGCGTASATITVRNVAPAPSIDTVTQERDRHLPAARFYPLDPITLNGSAVDVGSDDLTLSWSWGDGTPDTAGPTHFNDGLGPDPDPSPGGRFPFDAADSVEHAYALPGDYVVTLTATDDDGGSARVTFDLHVTAADELKADASSLLRDLKREALDRADWRFVQNLDDAERFVLRSLGYADPFRPSTIDVELGPGASIARNEGDGVDITIKGPFTKTYTALVVTWDDDEVTTIALPSGWPAKSLRYEDRLWIDAWEQDLSVRSKRDRTTGDVTLKIHAHDASLGFSLRLDTEFVAHLAFAYEVLPYWIDGAHLDPELGANVFVCERAAVDRFVKLVVVSDDDDDDDDDDEGDDDDHDGDRVLGGDGDDDEDDDDDGNACGCGGGDEEDEDDDCGEDEDDDDDDGGDDDRDGDRGDAGVLDDEDDDDDRGCRCGDGDDDNDEDDDEDDRDDDESPETRTILCRLTPKLWTAEERAALDARCALIANLLVKADEILARIALGEAQETPVRDPANQTRYERAIARSERSVGNANDAWGLFEYGHAICGFLRAWEYAERAIEIARM